MGASRNNPAAVTTRGKGRFPDAFRLRCEERKCVDWAVAFERITGWPLHVIHVEGKPVRAYCEDDGRWVFDVLGMVPPSSYGQPMLGHVVSPEGWPDSAFMDPVRRQGLKMAMRCLGGDRLGEFGLAPVPALVDECERAIRANTAYLDLVPERPKPRAAASDLSRYAFGGCVTYAEALSRITGLPAVTMTPTRMAAGMGLEGDGFHDAVLHPDGTLEDVWGRFPPERIAARYGMLAWELSPEPHARMMADALRTRPDAEADVEEAMRVAGRLPEKG